MLTENAVAKIVAVARRHPRIVLLAILLLCAASIATSVAYLRVNTDSSQMLADGLDFRERTKELNAAFPGIKNSVIVILHTETPDASVDAARRLAEKLRAKPDIVTSVFSPASDPFFQTNGLLYQDLEEVERSLEAINNAAPFLADLRKDPSLNTLVTSLREALALAENADFDRSFLERFFASLATVIDARLAGDPTNLSWLNAMSAEPETGEQRTTLLVSPKLDFSAITPVRAARIGIEQAIAELKDEVPYAVRADLTGDPILRGDELRSVSTGIEYSLLLSLFAVFLLLILAYRSLARALMTMVGLIVTLIITTGFAALAIGALNLVSIAFCVLLVGLGLDFSIHMLAHIEEKARAEGDAGTALDAAAHSVGPAMFLAAITTALAFFAFMPTDFVGMSQLGLIGGVGVLIAFVVSITVIPALVALMPSRAGARLWARETAEPTGAPKDGSSKRLQIGAAVLILLMCAGAATLAPQARFDADPMNLRDPNSPSVRALAPLYADPDEAPYRISILRPDEAEAEALAERLKTFDPVARTILLTSFVPKEQDEKLEVIDFSLPSFETIVEGDGFDSTEADQTTPPIQALVERLEAETESPGSTALANALKKIPDGTAPDTISNVETGLFMHFDALIKRFRYQMDIDFVEIDTIPESIKQRYLSESGLWRIEVLPKGDIRDPAALATFVESVQSTASDAAGAPLQIKRAGEVVASAMIQATSVAMFMVGVICLIVLRRPILILAVLFPLAVAAILTLGGSVLFDLPFNYANIIVLPLLIGLGVDSGIHLAMRRHKLDGSSALYKTSTPRAVLFSALTTIAAFASLGLSDHTGTASMGLLLTLAIGCTLASTIILTPVLMDLFDRKPQIHGSNGHSA